MQLYSIAFSPYAARVRIQVYHKQLPVTVVPPPGGLGSAQIRAKNPIGKIPVLDLGERALGESWAIMDYLETTFPTPPMRPADAFAWAGRQALVRFTDLYLAPAMFPLFRALRGGLDAETIEAALDAQQAQLQVLEQLLTPDATAALDLADAALLPVLWYAQRLAAFFGMPDCLAELPTVSAWWRRASAEPAAARVLAEMDAGLRAAMPALFAIAEPRP